MELNLPYPPSGNHMWKHAKGRHYLTTQAKDYYRNVAYIVVNEGKMVNIDYEVEVECQLFPPDRRRRDLDNAWKVIADSLTKAGVWQDDKQIRKLTLEWGSVDKAGGMATVSIHQRDAESVT